MSEILTEQWVKDAARRSTSYAGIGADVRALCASHEALRARVRDMEAAQAWQDIATAPKDGFFLVWSPEKRTPFVMAADIFHKGTIAGVPRHLAMSHITHWMPLPKAPS